jgi:hypothetical protein
MAKQQSDNKPGTKTYVCIRRCYSFGRLWYPQREAVREEDFLLKTDKPVSPKNFMQVEVAPALEKPPAEKGIALSQIDKADSFLT